MDGGNVAYFRGFPVLCKIDNLRELSGNREDRKINSPAIFFRVTVHVCVCCFLCAVSAVYNVREAFLEMNCMCGSVFVIIL